tara:strand:+ start:1145 stop:1369 length:225 start_codon:yes stop_codon:yes gene_type:complete
MEIYVNTTSTLYSDFGEVIIEATTLDPEEGFVHITFNARQLLKDIPSLYDLCKSAIEKEDKHIKEKYKQFKKKL